MWKYFSVVLLLCLAHSTIQRSTVQDTSYVAAVLEYSFTSNTTGNLENYLRYINEAAQQGADIVVFPELTLSALAVEVPIYGTLKTYPIPAAASSLYDSTLVSLSQAAIDNQIYIVVNLEELCDCTKSGTGEECPEAKVYYFNTNVVFDRNGAIIDRYRKINLFGERSRTPALSPDLGIFTTDFGVTFGHFICFDLLFQVPAVQVVQKNNISDVIFTTMWFSELPYLTAVQIQEGYAYAQNVNMLASGANNVRVGSAGSGIYSGKAGALISTMPGIPTTRLLVTRVPKVPGDLTGLSPPGPIVDPPTDTDSLFLKVDPSLASHVTKLLVEGEQEFTLSHNQVTCKFRVRLTKGIADEERPTFRAFVFDGMSAWAHRRTSTASCAVVACRNDEVTTCGYRYKSSSVTISKLDIKISTFKQHYNETLQCNDIAHYPTTLQTNKYPLNPNNFTVTLKPSGDVIVMKLKEPLNNLVAFGVWTRNFMKDDKTHYSVNEVPLTIEDLYNMGQEKN